MRDARRCPARSKRSGRPCEGFGLRRPDGTRTVHCYQHGGKQELLPPGDPERGGRPPTTFRYAHALRSEEDRALYEASAKLLGNLEEEIKLARTNLFRFQRTVEESAKGGLPVSVAGGGGSVTVKPYAQVVQEYLDLIGRLESRRAALLQQAKPVDDDLETYEAWVAGTRSPSSQPPSSSEA